MPSLSSLQGYVALVAIAALGGAVAVGVVALAGGLDRSTTTVVTETAREPSTLAAPPADAMSVNEIYERAAPGVIQIASTSSAGDAFSGDAPSALGSGFVVDKAGHIVTNFHVVENADEIRVSFSNRDTVDAELVGTDPSTDLAVLQVDSDASALSPLPLGDSDDVRVGDPVVAIGNPFGLDRTATAGIVSALQRLITAPNDFAIDHVIQTDAPINRGNSGGPLLNTHGEVIGVNTQIQPGGLSSGNVGIGFAVPSNTVEDVVAQILQTGHVEHAYLGIAGREVTEDIAATYNLPVEAGVLVQEVRPGTGAAKAGLEAGDTEVIVAGQTYVLGGDIIVAVDGERVSSTGELRDAIASHKPGDRMKLRIYRDAKTKTVTVTLGQRPTSAG